MFHHLNFMCYYIVVICLSKSSPRTIDIAALYGPCNDLRYGCDGSYGWNQMNCNQMGCNQMACNQMGYNQMAYNQMQYQQTGYNQMACGGCGMGCQAGLGG